MKFNRIVCVDHTKLNTEAIEELQKFSSEEVKVYEDNPESNDQIIERIGDAEAVIVSWKTEIGKEIIDACENIKYIGMACSLYDSESANVAVDYCKEKGIKVTGIKDYGDPGVAEFIVSELIQLLNGYKKLQWKESPQELTNLKIGIIGMGVTGKLLADCLKPFGADLYYFSKSRKENYEQQGVKYLELHELLKTCSVISLHLPKNATILNKNEFNSLGNGKILINTSLGLPFDTEAFHHWIKKDGNFAIFDGDGNNGLPSTTKNLKNVIALGESAGWSAQTLRRLSEKTVQNLKDFCNNSD